METNQNRTPALLDRTLSSLIDGMTGLALSEKTDYILAANRLLRGMRSGKFISQLNEEWIHLQEQGKISTNYEFHESQYDSLSEIFEYLDKDIPNHKIFNILKNIFIKSAIENNSESLLPLQYIKIAKNLNEGELIVLSTIYRLSKDTIILNKNDGLTSANEYVALVAKESGLEFDSLVEIHEHELISKKLITERQYPDKSGVILGQFFRLTKLGKSFCEYIENYK